LANTNKPSGLTPVKYLNGADWDGRCGMYYIDSTDGNAFYPGDLVKLASGLDSASGLQSITLGTAGATAVGAIVAIGASPSTTISLRGGPIIDPSDLTKTSAPATKTKNYFALVADDPMTIFEVQEIVVSAHAALTKVATSLNANIVYAAPATGVAVSGTGLDNNSTNTTSTLNLKILGLAQKLDTGGYNALGAYAKWLCLINNHSYRTGIAGI
jgi:hypothetical protein